VFASPDYIWSELSRYGALGHSLLRSTDQTARSRSSRSVKPSTIQASPGAVRAACVIFGRSHQ